MPVSAPHRRPGTTSTIASLTKSSPDCTTSTRMVCIPGGSSRIIATQPAATKVVACAGTPMAGFTGGELLGEEIRQLLEIPAADNPHA
jgi:hypothetical protein